MYDELVDYYHLIYADWDSAILQQSECLSEALSAFFGNSKMSIHDMTCGIGTQIIGLIQKGYKCTGSDLSREPLLRARRELQSRGLACHIFQADMRRLPELDDPPDVIISCDNSITHLPTKNDIIECLSNCYRQAKLGVLLTVRDYAKIDRTEVFHPYGKRVHREKVFFPFQHWMFGEDYYDIEFFFVEDSNGSVDVKKFVDRFYLHTVDDIMSCCAEAGFTNSDVVDCGYHQPVIVAKKPG